MDWLKITPFLKRAGFFILDRQVTRDFRPIRINILEMNLPAASSGVSWRSIALFFVASDGEYDPKRFKVKPMEV